MKKFSRIAESKSEDINLIKDLCTYLDTSEYIDRVQIKDPSRINISGELADSDYFLYQIRISWSKKCLSERKIANGFSFPIEEIQECWPEILNILSNLEKQGMYSYISSYSPSMVEMVINICRNKKNIMS